MLRALKTIGQAMAQAEKHPELLQKAVQMGDSDTPPKYLLPELDPLLQLLKVYGSELLATIPFSQGTGSSYIVNSMDEATEDLDASWVRDTQDLDDLEATGEYDGGVEFPYKVCAKRGKVSTVLQDLGKPREEIFQEVVTECMQRIKRDMVRNFLFGDSASNPKAPDGLFTLCADSQKIQAGSTDGGDPLSLGKMDVLHDLIELSEPDCFIMNKQTRRELSALLQQQQSFPIWDKIPAGFRVMWYNGVPILTNKNVSITQTYNGTTTTSQTGGSAASIYCLSWNNVFIKEKIPLKMLALGTLSCLYDKFDLYSLLTPVLRQKLSLSILEGILYSETV